MYYENEIWFVFGLMLETETNSKLFYFFTKMTIKQALAVFNSWHLPFFIVPYSLFQKNWNIEILTELFIE